MYYRGVIGLCLALVIVGIIISPVYGVRDVSFQNTVDVKKEFLLKALTDYNNYPKIFPDNIKSVTVSNNFVHIDVKAGPITFNEDATYAIQADGSYIVEIISGDLKGTKITSWFTDTWGFDGTPNGGTIVRTNLSLETSGLASFALLFVSDKDIKSTMGTAIYKFYQYAKNVQNSELKEKQSMASVNQVQKSSHASVSSSKNPTASDVTQSQPSSASKPSQGTTNNNQPIIHSQSRQQAQPVQESSYQIISISLQASSYSASSGNTITFSGRLTDSAGKGIPNILVYVKMNTPLYLDPVIAQGYTGYKGDFSMDWMAHKPHWYSNTGNFYAIFDGSNNYSSSKSQEISVSVY